MNKPTLWVMVGLYGSGKSSVAKEIAETEENTIIVSSDAIREELTGKVEDQSKNEEVFKVFHKRIREALENNTNVIADATNITIRSRRAIIENIKGIECRKIAYLIPRPFDQCKLDNLNRQHPVPEEVLDGQLRKFQIPFYEEGWDLIKRRDFLRDGEITIPDISLKMGNFDQKNPHHTMSLLEHSDYTYKLFADKEYPMSFQLGAVLHDVGKLYCQTFDEFGIAHYFDHNSIGSYLILTSLDEFYHYDILDACFLINYHMMPFAWTTEKSKERWKKRFGEYKYQMLLDFHECDKAR
jgi:predicted kinase